MTFEELERSLPNGFHDAKLKCFNFDIIASRIQISASLLVGLPGEKDPERYEDCTLIVSSIFVFFIEPPDPKYPFIPDGLPINMSGGLVIPGQNSEIDKILEMIPGDASVYRFFLEEWNSFLYLAAAEVTLEWGKAIG